MKTTRTALILILTTLMMLVATVGSVAARGHGKQGERSSQGQQELSAEEHVERHLARMTEHLGLDAEQVETIRFILTEEQAEREAIRASYANDEEAGRAAQRALHEETEALIKNVLTPAQLKAFEAHRSQRPERPKHGSRDRSHDPAEQVARMERALGLSADQVSKVSVILAEDHAQARQIIAVAGSREVARPQLHELKKASHQEIRALLTPAQVESFDAKKEGRCKG